MTHVGCKGMFRGISLQYCSTMVGDSAGVRAGAKLTEREPRRPAPFGCALAERRGSRSNMVAMGRQSRPSVATGVAGQYGTEFSQSAHAVGTEYGHGNTDSVSSNGFLPIFPGEEPEVDDAIEWFKTARGLLGRSGLTWVTQVNGTCAELQKLVARPSLPEPASGAEGGDAHRMRRDEANARIAHENMVAAGQAREYRRSKLNSLAEIIIESLRMTAPMLLAKLGEKHAVKGTGDPLHDGAPSERLQQQRLAHPRVAQQERDLPPGHALDGWERRLEVLYLSTRAVIHALHTLLKECETPPLPALGHGRGMRDPV